MNNFIQYQVGQNALLHLIDVSNYVESYYKTLKGLTLSENIKSWIEKHLLMTQAFKNKSEILLINTTEKQGNEFQTINTVIFLKLNLKYLFHKSEDHMAFEDCLKLNAYFLNQVNKEIKSGIHSKEVYDLLEELTCKLYSLEHEAYLSKLKVS